MLKKKNKFSVLVIRIIFLVGVVSFLYYYHLKVTKVASSKEIAQKTWAGYKKLFIRNGQVVRPKNNDVVSEGQAYAMLRAVWMDDKKTFDECYQWTEANLSRKNKTNDNLLAWRWQNGEVIDWMPASDADIDYALSLIFAHARWPNAEFQKIDFYEIKARKVLSDVLMYLTVRNDDGRLYLLPWIIERDAAQNNIPQNPSYYSPAHFKIFYNITKDERWLELVDTSYFLFDGLAQEFAGQKGVGMIPDWVEVDQAGDFSILSDRNSDFGWESVRVPLRVLLDWEWFKEARAKRVLSGRWFNFLEKEHEAEKVIYAEYAYNGERSVNIYENPLFYAAYYCLFKVSESKNTQEIRDKIRKYLHHLSEDEWYYSGKDEYFINSLSWFPEGVESGIIRNLY